MAGRRIDSVHHTSPLHRLRERIFIVLAGVFLGSMAMLVLIGSSHLFKVVMAASDTIPFYIGVKFLKRYLQIDPTQHSATGSEPHAGAEES